MVLPSKFYRAIRRSENLGGKQCSFMRRPFNEHCRLSFYFSQNMKGDKKTENKLKGYYFRSYIESLLAKRASITKTFR